MKTRILTLDDKTKVTLVNFDNTGEHYEVSAENLKFNGGPNDYNKNLYIIHAPLGNFYRTLGIIWGANEQEALDEACDAGLLDGEKMEDEGLDRDEDNVIRLGNASEPFSNDITIKLIPKKVWRKDFDFVYALGCVDQNPDIESWEDYENR